MMRASLLATGVILAAVATAQQSNLDLIAQRRKADLALTPTATQISLLSSYISKQDGNGTWPDVNYLAGCPAQRANWPIQEHWQRIVALSAAWSGLNPAVPHNYTNSSEVLSVITKGMDWWFADDFTSPDCIANGGLSNATCPCGTPGLWNTNWFDQVILIPQFVSTACLLVYSSGLSATQQAKCFEIPYRAYALRDSYLNGIGYITGANTINVMQNSISLALYAQNVTILEDAFDRAMGDVVLSDAPAADGIHPDGSFLQHSGILYTGNYGKDLLNAFLQLEGEAFGTSYAANGTTRTALATFVKGSEWMIFIDKQTNISHWDFNVLGRFVAFPVSDNQASASIKFNVTQLGEDTADFTGANNLTQVVSRLSSNGTEKLMGSAGFWASDYMVHRRDGFVLTNKMISNRSVNTEYVNSANPYGYHMGQGTLYSYVNGYEYRDIQDAWDWNLVPGTTTLLNLPKLNSSYVGVAGNRSFVGVASDGWVGTSVMDYLDPHDGNIAFRKAWFYLWDSVVVTTTAVTINTSVPGTASVPPVTVLDNRMAAPGGIYVDGQAVDASKGAAVNGSTLYYGGNGWLSHGQPFSLTLNEGNRTGNWSKISTSAKGATTVPIFSAYTTIPQTTYTYEYFPASTQDRLVQELAGPTNTPLDFNGTIGVAGEQRLSLVFWPDSPQTVSVPLSAIGWADEGDFQFTSQKPGVYLFATAQTDTATGTTPLVITLADPSQLLSEMSFSITTPSVATCDFTVQLPTGGHAGASVFQNVDLTF